MDMPTVTQTATVKPFYVQHADGSIDFNLHLGQHKAIYSPARFILLLAGLQSGKTVSGPIWLHDEINRRGPGDYLVVAPSYPIMNKKVLPEFIRLFETFLNLGVYRWTDRIFQFHDKETKIFFGHGDDPDSLESATAKAAWLDECGQAKFKLYSWEAIQGRLGIHQGRCFMSTTPYVLGWLKSEIYDRAKAGDPDYEVINFDSLMNPMFPREEYERAQRTLPGWRFRMRYQGQFERPAGMIYDCFDDLCKCPRFTISSEWKTYLGVDFGGVNTVAVFLAEHPVTKCLYAYKEYWKGGLTAKEHVAEMLRTECGIPSMIVGGSKSEDQWRKEFRSGGLPIREPEITEVEVGINRVYGEFKTGGLVIFDDLKHTLDHIQSYSRTLDDMGQPTEKIEDKESFHMCFVAGTTVSTPRGSVPIESVRPGDKVLTRQGIGEVFCASSRDDAALRRVEFSDGRWLTGTPDHPVWVQGKGFVPIDSLEYHDTIVVCENNKTFSGKSANSSESSTFDIRMPSRTRQALTSIEASLSFIVYSGNTSTALSRMGTRFTMLTKTLRTTLSKIWSVLPRQSIDAAITPANACQQREPPWMLFGTSPWHGTSLQRESLGTVSMLENQFTFRDQSSANAITVEKTIPLSKKMADGVPQSALPNGVELLESTTKPEPVPDAARNSESTVIESRKAVPVFVLGVRDAGKGTVYNLSVNGPHEYFANGVLVSNCDALRYIVGYLRGKRKQLWVR